MSNKPKHTIRDGLIKATIWENSRSDTGEIFYTVDIIRSYEKDGQWHETTSYSGAELLRVANLAQQSYNAINSFKAEAKAAA